jgi:hypothetical protein
MPILKPIGAPKGPLAPGKCVVCGKYGKRENEHCHTTLLPRGATCHRCNITLSRHDDDPVKLEEAGHFALANYIRSSEAYKLVLAGATKPPFRVEVPTARRDREGDRGICPVCHKRVLKGEKYVPRIWKGSRGHDWHIDCAERVGRTT